MPHTPASSHSWILYNSRWEKIADYNPHRSPAGHAKATSMYLFHLCFILPNLRFIKTWLSSKKEQKVQGWKDTSALFYKYVNEYGQIIQSASQRHSPYNISCEYHKLKQKERLNKEPSKLSRVYCIAPRDKTKLCGCKQEWYNRQNFYTRFYYTLHARVLYLLAIWLHWEQP